MVDLALLQSVSYIAGALGVCVAAAYYVINMRTTLQTRQAQLYMQIAEQLKSDSMWDHLMNIYYSDWSSKDNFQKWLSDRSNQISWNQTIGFFERAGVLVRKNLLDIDMVAYGFAGMTRMFWEKMAPMMVEQRKTVGQPRLASEFEFLYDRLMGYMERHPEFKT